LDPEFLSDREERAAEYDLMLRARRGDREAFGSLITQYMQRAYYSALARMMDQAAELGPDAVTDVRFTTSVVMGGAAEMLAFGNAVLIERE
jgi:uncharacterized protein YbjQ (UPF0145 family)